VNILRRDRDATLRLFSLIPRRNRGSMSGPEDNGGRFHHVDRLYWTRIGLVASPGDFYPGGAGSKSCPASHLFRLNLSLDSQTPDSSANRSPPSGHVPRRI